VNAWQSELGGSPPNISGAAAAGEQKIDDALESDLRPRLPRQAPLLQSWSQRDWGCADNSVSLIRRT
jgi:hypothetical protein